jgi:hypothetical protein
MALGNDDHDAKVRADGKGFGEEALDFVRVGVGRNIEILGVLAEQAIAHAAARVVGDMAGVVKTLDQGAGDGFKCGHKAGENT